MKSEAVISTKAKPIRNSAIELLRIFALFSVIINHVYAGDKEITGYNGYVMVIVNSIFNSGVGIIIFMLISGYYSIKLTRKRFNNTYAVIVCCVIATFILNILILKDSTFRISYLVPVLSFWQWYISCYVFTMLLSPFLNSMTEKANKKSFEALLGALIVLFYVLPTFFYFTITNDEGRGFVYMIIAYLIGRYISLYKVRINKKFGIVSIILLLAINTAGNVGTSMILGKMKWLFSRGLTIVSLLTAVLMLLLAIDSEYKSKFVNILSSKNIYVYLLMMNNYVTAVIGIKKFYYSPLLFPVCFGLSVLSYLISFGLAYILQYFTKLISKILELIQNLIIRIYNANQDKLKTAFNKLCKMAVEQ